MKHVILTVSVPKGQFVTIKKDGTVGYKHDGEGRRKVVGKIKRKKGLFYFVDSGKVFEADREGMLGRRARAKRSAKKMPKKPAKGRSYGYAKPKKTAKKGRSSGYAKPKKTAKKGRSYGYAKPSARMVDRALIRRLERSM